MVLIKEKAETRGAKLVKSSCFKDRTKRQMHKIYLYEIMQNYIRKLVDTHNDKKQLVEVLLVREKSRFPIKCLDCPITHARKKKRTLR